MKASLLVLSLSLNFFSNYSFASEVSPVRIKEFSDKYNTIYERPKLCPLESKKISDLITKIQTVQQVLKSSDCKNVNSEKLDEIMESIKELKEEDLFKNQVNTKIEDVLTNLDSDASMSVLGGVKISSVFSGLSSFLKNNKCKNDKRILESTADVLYEGTQIGLLSGTTTGVGIAAGGFLASAGLRLIDSMLKQKYDFSVASERQSFIKVNCSFYDIRRELEIVGVLDLENSSARIDLEEVKSMLKTVAEGLEILDKEKKDLTAKNSDFDKKAIEEKLGGIVTFKDSVNKLSEILKKGVSLDDGKPKETQKLIMITEVAKTYEEINKGLELYSKTEISTMPMLDLLFSQQMKSFSYSDFIKFQETMALSVEEFDQKVRANILFHTERIVLDIQKAENDILKENKENKKTITNLVDKKINDHVKTLESLKKLELRIGTLIQPESYSAIDDGSENLITLLEIHDEIAGNIYGEWGQKLLKFTTEKGIDQLNVFNTRFELFKNKYVIPTLNGKMIDVTTTYACQDAQKLRLIKKNSQSLIEQGYDFLATNKDLFYADQHNKFFIRMNEAGKAHFLLADEEKIQRHYMSATYANKILKNEFVSNENRERYLSKKFFNRYYIGYPMIALNSQMEKIKMIQDTYDKLECSKFLNKQLNF